MIRIRLTTFLGERIGGITSLEVSATTVGSALRALTDQYPALGRLVWSGEDVINPMMAVFLNDKILGPHLSASLAEGDQIDIVAAVSGGM
jgi:molybdopterin converting factor small subunit